MRRRRRWWLAGGAFGSALMLAFVWPTQDRSAGGSLAAVSRASVRSGLVTAAPAPASAPRSEAMHPVPAHGPDEVQICGGAWVKPQADGAPEYDDLARAAGLPEARERTIAALRANPDALSRATGLWLEMNGSSDRKAALLTAAAACDSVECQVARQVTQQAAQPADPEVAGLRDALARMALSSSDPRVYALALHVCGGTLHSAGACQMLSAAQWARLAPDNAAPWFAMLAAAKAANDAAAQDEALHRIATAKRSDQGFFAIPAAVLAAAPGGEASSMAALLLVGVEGDQRQPARLALLAVAAGAVLLGEIRLRRGGRLRRRLVRDGHRRFRRGCARRRGGGFPRRGFFRRRIRLGRETQTQRDDHRRESACARHREFRHAGSLNNA